MHDKVLIICGPTATGKTSFGLEVAKRFGGEIISADSRQVYIGRNIVTGKDLPYKLKATSSQLFWRDRYLSYYEVDGTKIWLYDVVSPGEPFNVSFWKACADIVIADVHKRGLLPIVVGGSGLFIKSLSEDLNLINIPYNKKIRSKLENKSVSALFDYLKSISPAKAAGLNASDRLNPRRLLRAIEISLSQFPLSLQRRGDRGEIFVQQGVSNLQLGLTAPRPNLYHRIDQRVLDRVAAGAAAEDPHLASDPVSWQRYEHGLVRRQLTWFAKQPDTHWFDISTPSWEKSAQDTINSWYNDKANAQKD